MMTLYRLIRLIENNSHALATCLLDRVQNSEATPEYARVPAEDLKERVYEIYRHLGDWLMTKDELDLELEDLLELIGPRAHEVRVGAQVSRSG